MTQLWTLLGAACIDPNFRNYLVGDKKDFQAKLDRYHFLLSNYEFGEAQRWFCGPQREAFQKALECLEPILWKNNTPCLTGVAVNAAYIPLTPDDLAPLQEKLAKKSGVKAAWGPNPAATKVKKAPTSPVGKAW
jgi:hypothetical protein